MWLLLILCIYGCLVQLQWELVSKHDIIDVFVLCFFLISVFAFKTSFGQPFVKRFALCYWTIVCLSFMSVTLVYYGQTVEWIKVKLGLEVGFSPGHIVSDVDPAPPPQKRGTVPPIFGPRLLWPNGWMDQDATWYKGRPRPRRHCVRWEPSSPLPKRGHSSPHFSTHVLWPNGWTDQGATWYGGRPWSTLHCVRWGSRSP